MKINNYFLIKLIAASLTTLIIIFSIFFLFSLFGNLGEKYNFLNIIYLSIVSSIQILTNIPLVIFFLIVMVYSKFLNSYNELKIILHYLSKKKIFINFLIFILMFIFLEMNKKMLSDRLENLKTDIIDSNTSYEVQLFIDLKNETDRSYTLYKNINSDSKSATIFNILNGTLDEVIYSNNPKIINEELIADSYFSLKGNQIIENLNTNILFIKEINSYHKKIQKFNEIKQEIELNFYLNIILLLFSFIVITFILFDKKAIFNKNIKSYFIGFSVILYTYFNLNYNLSNFELEFKILSLIFIISFFYKKILDEKYI